MAKKKQHTPGPWKADGSDKHDFRIIRGDREDVAFVPTVNHKASKVGQAGAANARLISAAPDLLAVCIDLQMLLANDPKRRGVYERLNKAVQKAEETI